MYPILFHAGMIELTSYSVLLGLSCGIGMLMASQRAAARRVDPAAVRQLSIWAIVAAITGSRLLYVALHWSEFAARPAAALLPVRGDVMRGGVISLGGLAMNGGVLLAIAVITVSAWRMRLPVLRAMDAIGPALPLGIALTRVGCFLNGCCYGSKTEMPWGVVFPAGSAAGHYQRIGGMVHAIHPAQLYAAAMGAVMFVLLLILERRGQWRDGRTACLTVVLYGAERLIEDQWRHYEPEAVFGGWAHSEYFSLALLASGLAGLFAIRGEGASSGGAEGAEFSKRSA